MLFLEDFVSIVLWAKVCVENIRMIEVHREMRAWQVFKDDIDLENVLLPMINIDGKDEHEAFFKLI